MLLTDAVAIDRRIAGARASMRLGGGGRFEGNENVLVIAVEAAQRSFDIDNAGVRQATAVEKLMLGDQLHIVAMVVRPFVFVVVAEYEPVAVLFQDSFFYGIKRME